MRCRGGVDQAGRFVGFCVGLLLLTAPAAAQSRGGHASARVAQDDVKSLAAQRLGFQVFPSGNPQADASVSWCIGQMLSGKVGLDEAVQIALLNNRNLQAELAEIGIGYGDMVDAGLLKNPVLDVLYRRSSESAASGNLDFSVALDFISILTLPMRRDIAASEFEATKLRVANEVLDLAFDVQSAYYQLQGALQMKGLFEDTVATSKLGYDIAAKLHEAGNITDLELHQQQALYEEQKLNLAEIEREEITLREKVNLLMGLWGPYTSWKIEGELSALPKYEFDGGGLESVAVYQRLDLAEARQEIETAARELGLHNATSFIPELDASGNFERETDGSWMRGGGVSLPIPLFNQGQGKVQSQRARLLQAQHRYYALAVGIRSEVRKAFGEMSKSRERVKYYDKVMVPLRKRISMESHLMYNAMELSPYELMLTKQDEIQSKQDRIEALRDYWMARSELERAMGGSFKCYYCPESNGAGAKQTVTQTGHGGANVHQMGGAH